MVASPSLSERYLKRLGATAPTTRDLASLTTLLEAHLRAIPFDTITPFIGQAVSLDPDATLSFAALGELGFNVEYVLARVYISPGITRPMAKTHTAVVVSLPEGKFLFDPGFGGYTPTMPVQLGVGDDAQEGKWGTFRAVSAANSIVTSDRRGDDVHTVMETLVNGTWMAMYGLTKGPVVEADIEAFNWYVSTSPDSHFTKRLMLSRFAGVEKVTGIDASMKHRTASGVTDYSMDTLEQVGKVLRVDMQLGADDALVQKVYNRLLQVGAIKPE
ncbi:N-terminal acetyltransferase [Apiotrichum porosum]|uniref:N-terminal acetyltransferase n=1 Tax=Apiotrichum porosum TaxID=105984 RepID=A0A427XUX8_9TREE|nr:N-terminal acetyltransferase [Apiotrichum porosum]RSH82659.1 N-terminal acetyltransferase [Apiotrichum porosum]